LAQHRAGQVAATRSRRPVQLVYYECFTTAAAAYRRERALKNGRTRKATRERLIATFPPARLAPFLG
jgi:predicted GIY-YIG superfamily endonuclease